MSRCRSRSLPLILACAGLAAPACDPRVHLGEIGDGGAALLWIATFERGDLSEWEAEGSGGAYQENIMVSPSATSEIAHAGRFAGKVTMAPTMGMASANYLFREAPTPTETYYSAWFYVPSSFTVNPWLSVIHFRGSHSADGRNIFPTWDINLRLQPDGSLAAQLYDFVGQINRPQANPPLTVPLDRWMHLEFLLSRAVGPTGRIAVWQNDTPILDIAGIATAENDWVQWNIGGSSDSVDPIPAVMYVDDAAISVSRRGAVPR